MEQAIIIAFTVFLGWTLLDYVKNRRVTKESLLGSLVVALLSGVVWFAMELIIGLLG